MLKDVLKHARIAMGLKQSDVAKEIGVTPQTYLKWENGHSEPKISQVGKLSNVLQVTVEEICKGEVFSNEADPLVFMRKIAVLKNALDEVTFTSILAKYINDQTGFIDQLEQELRANDEALQKAESEYEMREIAIQEYIQQKQAALDARDEMLELEEAAKEDAWINSQK